MSGVVGMTGRFARQQIELRTNAFWRLHWRWAAPGVIGLCVLAGTVGLLIPVSLPMWIVYPLLVLAVLSTMRPYFYGTYHLEMGAEAEAWTSRELNKLMGPGWHVVDGISFAFHDVDHVVVGPGGIYAVETKYTDSTIDLMTRQSQEWARRWAEQAAEGALSVRYLLWHQTRHPITPLVVVWGSEVRGTPRFLKGVMVVHRVDLHDFLAVRDGAETTLSPAQVEVITQELIEYRQTRVNHERRIGRRAA